MSSLTDKYGVPEYGVPEEEEGHEIYLEDVRSLLFRTHGVKSSVEQTGGGVATLLVGEVDDQGRHEVAVGPGWFKGPGWTSAWVSTAELAVGRYDDDEYEDGYDAMTLADLDWTALDVVDAIVRWLNQGGGFVEDYVRALLAGKG